jgi:hypothetical protein
LPCGYVSNGGISFSLPVIWESGNKQKKTSLSEIPAASHGQQPLARVGPAISAICFGSSPDIDRNHVNIPSRYRSREMPIVEEMVEMSKFSPCVPPCSWPPKTPILHNRI